MATTSGNIDKITERQTKFGPMYDVYVNGVQYGYGKYPPRNVKPGDFVTFDFEEKANGQYINRNIAVKTFRIDAQSNSAPPFTQAPTQTAAPSRVIVADDRQKVISKQAALNTGLTFLDLLVKNGAIKIPAKAPDAFTLLNTLFAEYAARLYEINTGEKWDLTGDDLTGANDIKPVNGNTEQFVEDYLPDNL